MNEIERAVLNLFRMEVQSAIRGIPVMLKLEELSREGPKVRGDTVKIRRPAAL